MSAIQLKNVPADLHAALRHRAAREGMDLQAYILHLVRRDLALPSEREWLEQLGEQPTVTTSRPAAEMLPAARDERDEELAGRDDRR